MAKLNEFNLCDYIKVVKFIYSMNPFLSKYLGCVLFILFLTIRCILNKL